MNAFVDREDELLSLTFDEAWRSESKIKACTFAVALVVSGPDVLLVRDRRHHRWELPGGFLEEGESPQACIRREVKEEAGMILQAFTPIGAVVVKPPQDIRRKPVETGVVFRADWHGELRDFSGDETSKALMFPFDSLPTDTARIDREIVGHFLRMHA